MHSLPNFDLSFPLEYLKPALLASLLSVWVLVGLFYYLNRYTRRPYFGIWTAAWACYSVWIVLGIVQQWRGTTPLLRMAQQCSVGTAAMFLLWGSSRFLNLATRGRTFGWLTVFLVVWSYLGAFHVSNPYPLQVALFGVISLASLVTAWSFYQFRQRRPYLGAGLLSMGFALWAVYLAAFPELQRAADLISCGFFISAVLQLFIAVSMIVLVLEEVRTSRQAVSEELRSQRSETALVRSQVRSTEQRYRSLFEHAHEGIIIAEAEDLGILELNSTAKRLLGQPENGPVLPSLRSFFQATPGAEPPPSSPADWLEWIRQHPQMTLVRADGSATPVELDGASIVYEGRPAWQFFLRELTERARLEQQLRQAEKLSALGQMVSGVAHELNNPLTVIKGYVELILSHHRLDAATRAGLEKVAAEGQRAAKIVRSFLAFAREKPLERRAVDLHEVISRVVELREFELRVMGIELALELDPQAPLVLADADQLQQVLLNLVNNSLHAMADLPGPSRLTLRSKREGQRVILCVEDTGQGVPDHLAARIFEPFFTTREVGAGTGLGLSICHAIMLEHGGRISCQRAPAGGACFVLEFPLMTNPVSNSSTTPPTTETLTAPPPPAAGPAQILVLDDEKPIAEMLAEMLSLLGHTPTLCHAAPHALELLEKHPFDLILSDIRMPIMDGKKFYQALKQQQPSLAERVIFLTGDTVNEDTRSFLEATGNRHLGKPFRLAAVEEAVTQALSPAPSHGSLRQEPKTEAVLA